MDFRVRDVLVKPDYKQSPSAPPLHPDKQTGVLMDKVVVKDNSGDGFVYEDGGFDLVVALCLLFVFAYPAWIVIALVYNIG